MGTTMHINSTASSDKVNMPLPGHVGQEFVRQYYTLLNKAPEFLYKFYGQSSTFIHGAIYKNGEQEEQCVGQENIRQKILSLDFADCRTKIRQVDACASLNTSVVVQVSGELSNRAAPLRRFMQTFVLCPQNGAPCKFYVQTDMFRYQDDVFQDEDSQSDSVEYVEQKEDSSKCVAGGDNQHSESVIDAAVHYQPKEEEAEEAVAFAEAAETSDAEEHLPVAVDAAVVEETEASPAAEAEEPTEVVQEKTADTAEEEPASATTTHSSSAATSESATPEKPVATPASTTSPVVSPPVEPVAKLATPVAPVVVEEPVAVVAPVVVVPQEPAKPVSWADMILKGTKSLTSLTYSPVVPQKVSAPPVSQAAVEPVTEAVEQQQQQQPQQQPQSTQHLPHQHQQRGGHRAHHHQRNNYQHNNNNHRNNNAGGGNYNNDGDFNQQQQRRSHNGPQTPRYPDSQQIFVGNLVPEINDADLKEHFSRFGTVLDVKINYSHSHNPNFGFVIFDSPKSVEEVLKVVPNQMKSVRINIEEKKQRNRHNNNNHRRNNGGGQQGDKPTYQQQRGGGYHRGGQQRGNARRGNYSQQQQQPQQPQLPHQQQQQSNRRT